MAGHTKIKKIVEDSIGSKEWKTQELGITWGRCRKRAVTCEVEVFCDSPTPKTTSYLASLGDLKFTM